MRSISSSPRTPDLRHSPITGCQLGNSIREMRQNPSSNFQSTSTVSVNEAPPGTVNCTRLRELALCLVEYKTSVSVNAQRNRFSAALARNSSAVPGLGVTGLCTSAFAVK